MSLVIGRCDTGGTRSWDVAADGTVTVGGELRASSVDVLVARRGQLLGHAVDVDAPVVPVTWDADPAVDGYYRVLDASVGTVPVLSARWLPWQATLEPVRPHARPAVTSALSQEVRANVHSVSTVACQHAVPGAAEGWSWLPAGTAQQEVRQTAPGPAGGNVLYRRVSAGTGLTTARWWCPPEHYFAGSCHVVRRVASDGAPGVDVPVVGRGSLDDPWRMGNGLVQCWLTSAGRLSVRWWLPSGEWSPVTEYVVGQGGGFGFTGWRAVEVTHLSPWQVTVRAQGQRSQGRSSLWLTLRRGSRLVSCTIDTDAVPGHFVAPAVATTVVDDGHHVYTPTGGSGLGWLIAAADAYSVNLGTGQVTPGNTLAPTWSWGIGAFVSGEAGDTGSRSQTWRDWYASRTEAEAIG